jgi:hypothetical protein
MISKQERIIVEGVRSTRFLKITVADHSGDHTIRIDNDRLFNHEVAIALQGYFNRNNKNKTNERNKSIQGVQ